jgi:membrane protein implicated in regulation of membrane protease activity
LYQLKQKAMANLYLIFIFIGLFGMLSSMIMGGDDVDLDGSLEPGDVFDDSPKVFSLRVIFSFMLAFGIGAGAVYYYSGPTGYQLLTGMISGFAIGGLIWWLTSILYRMQGASNVNSDDFIGKIGDIVIGTTPSGKAKVRLSTTSGPMEFLCREANNVPLVNGDLVSVTRKAGTLLIVFKK